MTTTTSTRWGAEPEDWERFQALELTEDLLPVVSNPQATVSPRSKLGGLGKTPSRYNAERQVVGIPQWTQSRTTDREVARWMRDPDLGICLQTRQVRALDLDLSDADFARRVRDCIELVVGPLPARVRNNSPKLLLAFRLHGEWTKRILRTAHGAIEFLANGQQFIAAGTHPSGARYEWEGGLPDDMPTLTPEEFEALWSAIVGPFGIAAPASRRGGAGLPARVRAASDANDPVLEFLERTGWVRSFDGQGRAHITCPWEHEHSDAGQGSESATTWFPAGVGGFAQGHFRCLHAHCEGRTDGDFIEAIGYVSEDFEIVEPAPGEGETPPILPAFARDRTGSILATLGNLRLALERPDVAGVHLGYDTFRDELMLAPWRTQDWRAFADADAVELRDRLEAGGFKPIGRELMRDAITQRAARNRFDTAQMWLDGLRWDGVPRVERFFERYFGAGSGDYARSVSLYLWTALAGRVIEPGCKCDMVPILVGAQGVGKSTGVAAMVPSTEHFLEVRFDDAETELARRMRGKLVAEIGELRGMASREIEHIKAFVTRTHEEWVPKYKEFSVQFPRRLVFIGTTNSEEFLADETGNRRWLPLRVGKVERAAIARDRDQLWAEAAVLFAAYGVAWGDAQELATDVHDEHTISDPWEEAVERWLNEPSDDAPGASRNCDGTFKLTSLMQAGLGISVSQLARKDEMRVARILRGLGFERVRFFAEGSRVRAWQRAKHCEEGESAKDCALKGPD